ncbi:L-fuculose-phosphate aldolase [Mariprofundus ferrinatatus]|uniref:L-fuculose-phosphate aldolase n=1 Tax=Mariprofundus ferrinatatus TaxID=1921087 RepID=A0A2K8L2H4_9PROT|nr:class II aldolase/adducin family protein [Mariprofundus ferrinatatus]ATX81518.1 L-fuculose-phosphate aldolase [Mariprofundus ferrinatatus]
MDQRVELVKYYHWLRQYGYNDSHSGNISGRDGGMFWVTPTGACADTLQEHHLISCSLDGALPEGASGDANLHRDIYRQNPKAQAIIHSHCPHAVALTLNGEDFVPPDFEGQLYFPRVPVITVPYATYFQEAAAKVAATLRDHPICIVRGHGVYAWGETLNLAYKWSCSLELSAKTAFIARQAGTI